MTTVDFKAEVEKRRDEMMADLYSLLEINSERDDSKADAEHPFGPGPVKALEKFLEIAKRDGYETKNVDNYAGHFTFGEGEEELGIFAHMDVVPAGSGWKTDPYKPEIIDGKLYARGSSDDKGPTMACYYGLKIIKDLGLPVSKRVRFVVGTDEESGWGDMDYYFKHVGLPEPDFGFSPDAEFPIINGEKGNITEYLHFGNDNTGSAHLHSFTGGLRENMVPESATAVVSGQLPDLAGLLDAFAKKHQLQYEISTVDEETYTVTIVGKSAHGSTPEDGINGATYLALLLNQFDFGGAAKAYLHVTASLLHEDFAGEKLGIAHTDAKMGPLSMNAGVFHFDESHGHTPHYVPMDDELVSTLLRVYEKQTGLQGHEQVIGGGTFGRLLKRGVAFGAMFPDYVNTMHQANEFADVEDLYRAAAIYAEAIYELIK